jgi:UDP-4-amino-4,6-dideoxy-N-acetyl-beta-L-altrosamine transaminase
MTSRAFLPYSRQNISDADIAAVADALRSDFLTTGPRVEAFEAAVAEATGAPHAVVVSSGTAALHIAVMAAGCRPGDIWIVPTVTFVATANAVRYCGGEVVFADVDPDTGLMRASDLEAAISRAAKDGLKPSGVLPVHMGGQVDDPEAIAAVASRHGLTVIEDAAHSLGAAYIAGDGKEFHAGGCAHCAMAALSLHPVKTVTMGEGGVVTTRDKTMADRLRRLREHGIERQASAFQNADMALENGEPNPWYYELHELGFNYRATDIHCALGLSQIGRLGEVTAARAELRALYPLFLPQHVSLVPVRGRQHPAWHLAVALIAFEQWGTARARVMAALKERGIGSQVHYIPVHRQPYYRARYGEISLPGADRYYSRCLSLPLFPGMNRDDVKRVADGLQQALGQQHS